MTLTELREGRPHWSFSSLNTLLNICSLQWAFERHWKTEPDGPVPGALTFGSAFHRALEWQATARMNGEMVDGDALQDLFATVLERQVEEDGEVDWKGDSIDDVAEHGRKLVRCYLDNIEADERVLVINHTFCVPLVDAEGNAAERPLIGEADCITRNGKTSVVDWKTSAARYSDSKVAKSMQATAFLFGVGRSFGPVDDFRFDVVVKLKREPAFERYSTERTENDFHRLASLALVAEELVTNETFHPAEGGFASPCGSCRFKGACSFCRLICRL